MMAQDGRIQLDITHADAGRALIDIVQHALGDQTDAAHLIKRGGLWLGTQRVGDGSAPASPGAQLTIRLPPGGVYGDLALDPAWIIYEDADLVALDKPAGTYTGMTPWDIADNVHAALHRWLAARDNAPPQLHAAHRLDRDTSGVLLFSKNPAVNRALQRAFAERMARKAYLCLCAGIPENDEFTVETGHGRTINGYFHAYPPEHIGQFLLNGGVVKPMRTRFVVARRLEDAALLHAFPETGRTHQIRLHAAYVGHPLLGDAKYGGPRMWRGESVPQHLLHAARLELPHPRTRQPLVLCAEAPAWAEIIHDT